MSLLCRNTTESIEFIAHIQRLPSQIWEWRGDHTPCSLRLTWFGSKVVWRQMKCGIYVADNMLELTHTTNQILKNGWAEELWIFWQTHIPSHSNVTTRVHIHENMFKIHPRHVHPDLQESLSFPSWRRKLPECWILESQRLEMLMT